MDCKDLIETYEKKRKEKTDKKKEADKRKSGAGGMYFIFFLIYTYACRKFIAFSFNDNLFIFFVKKKAMQYQIL